LHQKALKQVAPVEDDTLFQTILSLSDGRIAASIRGDVFPCDIPIVDYFTGKCQ